MNSQSAAAIPRPSKRDPLSVDRLRPAKTLKTFMSGDCRFNVAPGYVLPNLNKLLPPDGQLTRSDERVEATYYDTPSGGLATFGITVSRVVGSDWTGWQLRIPTPDGEASFPVQGDQRMLPEDLAKLMVGLCPIDNLVAVASTSVTRSLRHLLDARGALLARVADDHVQGSPTLDLAEVDAWRRVELEVGPAGDGQLLKSVGRRLLAGGAQPSTTPDLERLIGSPLPAADLQTAGGVALAYLSEQGTEFVRCHIILRNGQPEVHRFRVAVRRIRSTLRVFRHLFEPQQSAALSTELAWLSGLLGEVRDRDVLLQRLIPDVQALPAELVLGSVGDHIETTLLLERTDHQGRVAAAMESERYAALVNLLRTWRHSAPLTRLASKPASTLRRPVRRAEQRLGKTLGQAGDEMEGLHSARKVAKRLRYAAELAPLEARQETHTIKTAAKLQDKLGEHHDSVISAEFLRRIGAAAGSGGDHNGFTYGILCAQELARAERIANRAARRGIQRLLQSTG